MIHYLYKITNNINGKIYVGIHSTDKLDDSYMGSGKLITKAIKKYGKQNFTKVIIKICNTLTELKECEAELVNEEFINRTDTYNIALGGQSNWTGKVSVKDRSGNTKQISCDDSRYVSGKLVHVNKYMVPVKDKNGNNMQVPIDDPRYLSGELQHIFTNMTLAIDKGGNKIHVNCDDIRLKTGELVSHHKGRVSVKDKDGNTFKVSINDPRYLSGELVGVNKGTTFTFSKPLPILKCPHCGKEGKSGVMKRWHFDRCKSKVQKP